MEIVACAAVVPSPPSLLASCVELCADPPRHIVSRYLFVLPAGIVVGRGHPLVLIVPVVETKVRSIAL
jgi:hypothetical protein